MPAPPPPPAPKLPAVPVRPLPPAPPAAAPKSAPPPPPQPGGPPEAHRRPKLPVAEPVDVKLHVTWAPEARQVGAASAAGGLAASAARVASAAVMPAAKLNGERQTTPRSDVGRCAVTGETTEGRRMDCMRLF